MVQVRYIFTFFALLFSFVAICQENPDLTINLDEIKNAGKRVEVQRYIGYEDLLARYTTLPYDVSANTSNQGRYFDIGYAIMALFPIALLVLLYKRKKAFYACMFFLILYLSFVFNYSFVNIEGVGPVYSYSNNWEISSTSETRTPVQVIITSVYRVAQQISSPIISLVKSLSVEKDRLTYFILFILFCGSILFTSKVFANRKNWSTLLICTIGYSFFWLVLSGGIIWYGFLILPLAYIFIMRAIRGPNAQKKIPNAISSLILLLAISPWVLMSYVSKVGNESFPTANMTQFGKNIIHPQLSYYATGIHDHEEVRNMIYRNNSGLFDQINSNNDLIFQVGTSMTFEIRNNPYRCFQDNTLNDFFKLLEIEKDKVRLIDYLRGEGFRYIIIDLFTHTLDKTPERSLIKKYQLFLNTIYQNPKVRLMATDRVVQVKSKTGEIVLYNDVFGKSTSPDDQVSIRDFGSYAVYEIIQ